MKQWFGEIEAVEEGNKQKNSLAKEVRQKSDISELRSEDKSTPSDWQNTFYEFLEVGS